MTLEVLVVSMGQTDLSLSEKMHLRGNVLIANQADFWGYEEKETQSGKVRMITTATRGVGVNRNQALSLAEGDILLFADDDITYYDGALESVLDAFRELPDADVIFFGIDMTRNGEIFDRRRNQKKHLHIYNSLKYGAARMAVRRSALKKGRLAFSTLFGGGCIYGSGEDTLFICDCFRAGLRVYSHPLVLGACAKDSSSWFTGFNEKYMFDKGAWIACAFPKSKHLMKWYFIRRFSRKSGLPLKTVIRRINDGIRAFRHLGTFEDITLHQKQEENAYAEQL